MENQGSGFRVGGGKPRAMPVDDSGSGQAQDASKPCPLTEAELHVMQACVCCGTSRAQDLAEELSCSHHTVRNHFTSILTKTGASDRGGALVICIREGWISPARLQCWPNGQPGDAVEGPTPPDGAPRDAEPVTRACGRLSCRMGHDAQR